MTEIHTALERVYRRYAGCTRCPLHQRRTTFVFGEAVLGEWKQETLNLLSAITNGVVALFTAISAFVALRSYNKRTKPDLRVNNYEVIVKETDNQRIATGRKVRFKKLWV